MTEWNKVGSVCTRSIQAFRKVPPLDDYRKWSWISGLPLGFRTALPDEGLRTAAAHLRHALQGLGSGLLLAPEVNKDHAPRVCNFAFPDPCTDAKSRSTLKFCSLHCSIGVLESRFEGSTFWILPWSGALGIGFTPKTRQDCGLKSSHGQLGLQDKEICGGIHIYLYLHIHRHIQIYISRNIYVYRNLYIYLYLHLYLYLYLYLYLHLYVYLYLYIYVDVYLYIYIYVDINRNGYID